MVANMGVLAVLLVAPGLWAFPAAGAGGSLRGSSARQGSAASVAAESGGLGKGRRAAEQVQFVSSTSASANASTDPAPNASASANASAGPVSNASAMPSPGGLGEETPATAELQFICDALREMIESFLPAFGWSGPFSNFSAVSYRSQIVNGRNFFVKIDLDLGRFLLVRIYQPPTYMAADPELVGLKLTTQDEPITYIGAGLPRRLVTTPAAERNASTGSTPNASAIQNASPGTAPNASANANASVKMDLGLPPVPVRIYSNTGH